MGYIAVPGSNTDLYSGTILSSQTGTAEGVDGAILGKLCIYLCAVHVISPGRGMMNLALNVCFDFFSRHENQIWK